MFFLTSYQGSSLPELLYVVLQGRQVRETCTFLLGSEVISLFLKKTYTSITVLSLDTHKQQAAAAQIWCGLVHKTAGQDRLEPLKLNVTLL